MSGSTPTADGKGNQRPGSYVETLASADAGNLLRGQVSVQALNGVAPSRVNQVLQRIHAQAVLSRAHTVDAIDLGDYRV